jgi:hypothetical protein
VDAQAKRDVVPADVASAPNDPSGRGEWPTESAINASEAAVADEPVTDLYVKALQLLGSGDATVRIGGLYALDQLAQDTSSSANS